MTRRGQAPGRRALALLACLGVLPLAACDALNPAPWEKDLMAKKVMQPGYNGIVAGIHDHIYFSKEGASGGRSTAGGGCGCN